MSTILPNQGGELITLTSEIAVHQSLLVEQQIGGAAIVAAFEELNAEQEAAETMTEAELALYKERSLASINEAPADTPLTRYNEAARMADKQVAALFGTVEGYGLYGIYPGSLQISHFPLVPEPRAWVIKLDHATSDVIVTKKQTLFAPEVKTTSIEVTAEDLSIAGKALVRLKEVRDRLTQPPNTT